MSVVRVKPDVSCAVFGPDGAIPVTPDLAFDSSDWVVKNYPQFFLADDKAEAPKRTRAVPIEDTSATPGRLRNR